MYIVILYLVGACDKDNKWRCNAPVAGGGRETVYTNASLTSAIILAPVLKLGAPGFRAADFPHTHEHNTYKHTHEHNTYKHTHEHNKHKSA